MTKLSDSRSQNYTNRDIVTMAVYLLGGALRHIHLEDVAMKAGELAPRRFCWKKYPDQINLEAVRLALKDELAKPDGRVLGGIRDGWMLTPAGFSWCLDDNATSTSKNQAALDELHREIDRATKTEAFSKTAAGKGSEVSIAELESLLRVDRYFTARDRRERVAALTNAAVLDSQLQSVLSDLRAQGFSEMEVSNE